MNINPKFRSLIPPLAPEELAQLEANIIADGCRDPLVTWQQSHEERGWCKECEKETDWRIGDGNVECEICAFGVAPEPETILIDGHNRYDICTRHGIKFETVEKEFESETHARIWMRNNQKGRRNLSDAWRIELELGNKEDLAEIGKAKRKETEGRPSAEKLLSKNDNSFPPEPKHDTRKEIAAAVGVSTGKLAQAEVIKKKSPELWEKAKAGEMTIGGAYKATTTHVGHNSGENEWYTPKEFTDAATEVMEKIDLDPASSEIANVSVKAAKFYTAAQDGLSKKWHGRVWMNPPYAQPLIGQFCEKLAASLDEGTVTEAIALVNNATETAWFAVLAEKATAMCFARGRIRFLDPNGKPGAPLQGQAVVYMGDNAKAFVKRFKQFGFCCNVVH